jgi:biofilm PGA synthesis protein PgaA
MEGADAGPGLTSGPAGPPAGAVLEGASSGCMPPPPAACGRSAAAIRAWPAVRNRRVPVTMNLLEIRAKSYSIVFALVVPLVAATGTAQGAAPPPQAVSQEPGEPSGDRAAELIRRGWAAGDPAERRRLAAAAIALLEAMRRDDPDDERALGDLLLAFRLAERMEEVVALWEGPVDRAAAPHWLVNAAADAHLALGRLDAAERLYRRLAEMRPEAPEPWLGLYWTAVEDRRFADARRAAERLAAVPGEAWTARRRAAWLLLYEDRTAAGLAAFEALVTERPDDLAARQGLATAHRWLGRPRGALAEVAEIARRSGAEEPADLPPAARIVRAGALADTGALGAARREAEALARLVPENLHARRLAREVDALLSPEARVTARYDTSDRGFGELWSEVAVDAPLGARARLGGGVHVSRAEDEREAAGDVEQAFLALSARPAAEVALSAEAGFELGGGFDRDPSLRLRAAWLPTDRWRLDLGWIAGGWRDLPLRARAAGLAADAWDAGLTYTAAPWQARAAGGRADHSDGNQRTWGLAAGERQVVAGPFYRAFLGGELWASENSRTDVAYFSPESDLSAVLTHRSEWVLAAEPGRRWVVALVAQGGAYEQEGFDAGAVGGLWLRSDLDLAGRAVLLVEAGARSQLYDGERETLPRVSVLVRRRF